MINPRSFNFALRRRKSASRWDVPLNVRAKSSSSQAANDSSHDFTTPDCDASSLSV
jgi:hypothetical protein